MNKVARQLKDDMNKVIALAKEVGKAISDCRKMEYDIEIKGDGTPVTSADFIANKIVCSGLQKIRDIPIVSEESEIPSFAQREQWKSYWLVDPLDGTREFIRNNGQYSVNIALMLNNRPIIGVIYAPDLHWLYYAASGIGAFKQVDKQDEQQINCQAVHHPKRVVCGNGVRRIGFPDAFKQIIENMQPVELIHMGSSIKSCMVADGQADIYLRFGITSEWDTAAAQCIVEEAGGKVKTLDLQTLCYNQKESIENPEFMVIGDQSVDWKKYF